jgi:hypothetical protein
MHIYISICVTLLTLIAAMHLLLKAKKEEVSSLFKWISYFIVLVGLLILLCQLARGIKQMLHHGDGECREECHPWMRCGDGGMGGMHGGMHGYMMYGHDGMKCCDMDEEECGDMKMKGDCTHSKMECKDMMGKEDREKGEKEEHEEKREKK